MMTISACFLSLAVRVVLWSEGTGDWCPVECEECPGNTLNGKVEQLDSTTSKVTLDNCSHSPPWSSCVQTQEWVANDRRGTVTGQCENGCKLTATPIEGKSWGDVESCADVVFDCEAC
jgi:hypothetical protein